MTPEPDIERLTPDLKFAAAVSLRFDTPQSIGETPDGVRLDFRIHGTIEGPELRGNFPSCAAYLLIDVDGVGTIHVRAPLLLDDGAVLELEATGRYDFGQDGYRRAVAGDLPDSALGWCPRFLTGHPRYLWLNRALFLGIGVLRPRETRVDYDLFLLTPRTSSVPAQAAAPPAWAAPDGGSLYDRLGGQDGIHKVAGDFFEALLGNVRLNRQNPKVAVAHGRLSAWDLKMKAVQVLSDLFCRMTGGPCQYTGRSLKEAHAHLDVSDVDWALMTEDLVRVLNRLNVGRAEQDELLALIETTKAEIVQA